jgi:hypothetical protein
MRIVVAAVILLDLCIRSTDLEAFYSGDGVAPIAIIQGNYWHTGWFSLHAWSGSVTWEVFLFCLSAGFALMLMIGYLTRLSTILSWIMMLSLHARNPIILQGGDELLRLILFWGMFIPWGNHYSVDAIRKPANGSTRNFLHLAGLAYMLQVAYVYGVSALEKGPEWHSDFTALYYVYHLDQLCYPVAIYLSHFPEVLKYMTASVFYLELLIPVLLFFPFRNQLFRSIGFL